MQHIQKKSSEKSNLSLAEEFLEQQDDKINNCKYSKKVKQPFKPPSVKKPEEEGVNFNFDQFKLQKKRTSTGEKSEDVSTKVKNSSQNNYLFQIEPTQPQEQVETQEKENKNINLK